MAPAHDNVRPTRLEPFGPASYSQNIDRRQTARRVLLSVARVNPIAIKPGASPWQISEPLCWTSII
jgi:hypothetical protein